MKPISPICQLSFQFEGYEEYPLLEKEGKPLLSRLLGYSRDTIETYYNFGQKFLSLEANLGDRAVFDRWLRVEAGTSYNHAKKVVEFARWFSRVSPGLQKMILRSPQINWSASALRELSEIPPESSLLSDFWEEAGDKSSIKVADVRNFKETRIVREGNGGPIPPCYQEAIARQIGEETWEEVRHWMGEFEENFAAFPTTDDVLRYVRENYPESEVDRVVSKRKPRKARKAIVADSDRLQEKISSLQSQIDELRGIEEELRRVEAQRDYWKEKAMRLEERLSNLDRVPSNSDGVSFSVWPNSQ
jgi:hypothetical protein